MKINNIYSYQLFLLLVIIVFSSKAVYSQVGINNSGNAPDHSSMLDVESVDKGFLMPRIALTSTDVAAPVLTPTTSLMVYNTNFSGTGNTAVTPGYYFWDGSQWQRLNISRAGPGVPSGGGFAGEVYIDKTTGDIYTYNGTSWVNQSSDLETLTSLTDNGNGTITYTDENGASVTINVDNQSISGSGLSGTDLTIGIEGGSSEVIDLSSLQDGTGTDDQAISLSGNTLTLEDGGTVDLTPYLDNTDAQALSYNAATNVVTLSNGGTIDLSGLNNSGTDDQVISLSGNTLTLEDGGTVNLAPYLDNTDAQALSYDPATNIVTLSNGGTIDLSGLNNSGTDDQNISGSGLSGTDLTIGIEGGTSEVVDLSSLQDGTGTDDQAISLSGNTLTLEDGGIVDLTPYLDNTDAQALSYDPATNIVTLSNGGTIDLSGLNNSGTDDQNISGSGLSGTDLTIGIEGGSSEVIDLSSLQDGTGTDDQTLTLSGTDLSIEDGNTVDLSTVSGLGTDDQVISLSGNTLTLEDGGTVDLTPYLDNTDAQALSYDPATNIVTLSNGGTIDLSGLNNSGTDDQNISGSGLSGTDLTIGIEGGSSEVIDLSSLQDGTGTDDQTLTLSGTDLSIEDGNTVDLSTVSGLGTDDQVISLSGNTLTLEDGGTVDLTPYLDNTDAQALSYDPATNIVTLSNGGTIDLSGLNNSGTDDQTLTLSGTDLSIEDGNTIDLSTVSGLGTDDQNISGSGLSGTDLTIGIEGGTSEVIDLSSLQDGAGTDDQTLTLSGTDLSIEDGNTVDLSTVSGLGTDDQTISLSGNTLTLEDGGTVDLTPYLDNTDAQALSYDPATNIVTLSNGGTIDLSGLNNSGTDDQTLTLSGTDLTIEDGNTVDLSSLQDGTGTDDQNLTLTGTNLSIEDGNTVDLSTVSGLGTDDQNLTGATLTGTSLQIDIEGGTSTTVDLAPLQDGVDDADADPNNEKITSALFVGNTLIITEAGNTHAFDLSSLINDADSDPTNEYNSSFTLSGSNLTITDGAGNKTVDLSPLTGTSTDDQNLTGATLTGTSLQIDIEGGSPTTVDLAPLQDGVIDADADPNNEKITSASFVGNTLIITEAGNTHAFDLSSLKNDADSDPTNEIELPLTATTGEILQWNGTDWVAAPPSVTSETTTTLVDNTDGTFTYTNEAGVPVTFNANINDNDADPTNEYNTSFTLSGADLMLTDGGGTKTVDLSPLTGTGTDDQAISLAGNILTLEDGGTVNLTPYLDNTDAQALSYDPATNIVTLSNGGTIDLSGLNNPGTDDQNLTGATLTGTSLQIDIEGGTSTTVDLAPLQDGTGTDDQTLTLSGTDLSIEDGNTVDLSTVSGLGTDDQNISGSGLSGTDLTIGIEGGTSEVVDLSSLQDGTGTDDQAISLSGNTLTLEDGGTVDLTPYLDNTDAQALSYNAVTNIVTLSNGGTIDLSGLNNSGTDDQNLTLTGTNLSIEDGNTVDLSTVSGLGTDDQTISLSGNTLTLEDGGTVDLTPYLDNTDAQALSYDPATNIVTLSNGGTIDLSGLNNSGTDDQTLTLSGNDLTIEDGNTVDLSGLTGVGTDNQNLTGATLTGTSLQIDIEGGSSTTVDLAPLQDGTGTDDQNLTGATLTGTSLQIDIEGGTSTTVDLAPLQDGTGTDDQTLTLSGTDLTIEDGNTVDLSSLTGASTDDQNLTGATLTGTSLQIDIEGGTSTTVDLAPLQDGVDDADADPNNEKITSALFVGNTLIITEAGNTHAFDLSSLKNDADSDPTNEIELPLTATTGEILQWNGTDWVAAPPSGTSETTTTLVDNTDGTFTYTNEAGVPVIFNANINDNDADPTNEYNTSFTLSGADLKLTDGGGTKTVDLSPLAGTGTDDQNLTGATLTGTSLQIDIEGGTSATVNLAPLQDGVIDADADPNNEKITSASFVGNTLIITEAGNTHVFDLSSLKNDADSDPTNEYNSSFTLSGSNLNLTDGGGVKTVDLSPLTGTAADDQTLAFTGTNLAIEDGNTVDLSSLQDGDAWGVTGENQIAAIGRTGNVGIGTTSPTTKLHVEGQARITNTPLALKTDSILFRDANGVLKQMSVNRFMTEIASNTPIGDPSDGDLGACTHLTVGGDYIQNTSLNGTNTITLDVYVYIPGSYLIKTDPVNGYFFIKSGTFTSPGVHQVTLVGSGNPIATGTDNITVNYNGTSCNTNITVNPGIASGKVDCDALTVNGDYIRELALTASETITIEVNFSSLGTWSASTDEVNGYSFSGSGTVVSTGIQMITLTGTGIPLSGQTDNFTLTLDNQNPSETCSFNVTVDPGYSLGTVHCGSPTVIKPVTSSQTGKVWMDRNLGATRVANSSSDPAAYGDLYQWGRSSDGHQCRESDVTTTKSNTDQVPPPNTEKFISASNDWRNSINNNLWQEVTGINNPCPNGYRVPTLAEFQAEVSSWSGIVDAYNSEFKFTLAGERYTNANLYQVGSWGYYWTSTVQCLMPWCSGVNYIGMRPGAVYSSDTGQRVLGHSVRCIKY